MAFKFSIFSVLFSLSFYLLLVVLIELCKYKCNVIFKWIYHDNNQIDIKRKICLTANNFDFFFFFVVQPIFFDSLTAILKSTKEKLNIYDEIKRQTILFILTLKYLITDLN